MESIVPAILIFSLIETIVPPLWRGGKNRRGGAFQVLCQDCDSFRCAGNSCGVPVFDCVASVIPSKTAFTFANFSRFPFPYTSLLAGDTCAVHTLKPGGEENPGTSEGLPAMTTEEITLTYMHFDNDLVVKHVADAFMKKYPNITVKTQVFELIPILRPRGRCRVVFCFLIVIAASRK